MIRESTPTPPGKRNVSAPPIIPVPEDNAVRFLFLGIFFVFLIIWVISWAAFHVAGGLIHILLVIAVISLILHFVRGSRSA